MAYATAIATSRILSNPTATYISFWLPAGIYVAGLLLLDTISWPVLAAAFVAINIGFDLQQGAPLLLCVLLAVANTVESVLGAYLFRRFMAPTTRLTAIREFVGLVVCTVGIGPAVGGAVGAATLLVYGEGPSYVQSWSHWWVGNSMAILLVTPIILSWFQSGESSDRWWRKPSRLMEAMLLVIGFVASAWKLNLFGQGLSGLGQTGLLIFILWSALRFGVRGASVMNLLFGLLLAYLSTHVLAGQSLEQTAARGQGPSLQLFLAASALVGLIPAIVLAERDSLLQKLAHSEERFRTLSQASFEAVVLTENGVVLDANEQALGLLRCSRDKLIGRTVSEMISQESRAVVAAAIAADREISYEHRMQRFDGSSFDAEAQAKVMRLGARKIRITAIRDVTERHRAEAALRSSEERFRNLIEQSPDAIIAQREGVIIYANPAAVRLHGATEAAELIGKQMLDLIDPAFHSEVLARRRALAEGLGKLPMTEMRLRQLNGSSIDVEVQSAAVEFNGKPVIQITARDITARMRAQLDANRLAAIVKYSEDAIISEDTAGIVTSWNHAAGRLFGYEASEILGKPIQCLIPPVRTQQEQEILAKIPRGESVGHFETVRLHRDGRAIQVAITVSPLRDAHGEIVGVSTVARDITERLQLAAERLQLERKLQDTQKLESLGVMAGGIAHDFNNLLTAIAGNASLASMELGATSPIQANLSAIKEGSRQAADLCKQMLAYSGRGRFVVQNLSLNRLVEETTHLLQISISKQAVLRFNLYKDLPPIEADATQIRQVIMNLVINASEAIGEKSGIISLNTGLARVDRAYLGGTVMAPELPEGTYVYLEVSDSGCGMTEETRARIFDPFFTTKFSGRGLGLAAVLGIVRGHRGALKVYSEPGRGSTFKLLFPCAPGREDSAAQSVPGKAEWRGHGDALVMDDEESVRSTAAAMLRKLGFTVTLAADGREGVRAFQEDPGKYTIVLTDLTMPHLDGEATFHELRRIRGDVRVILMSGFNEQEAISRFTGKGLASFLQKPFVFEELRNVLLAVMDRPTDRS